MEVKHSKAILVLGQPGCNALDVIKGLTGTAPQRTDSASIAGLTHQWSVRTKYYSATIPIWVDEVADVEQWKAEFLKPEAKEVVEAVGAWIVCFSDQVAAEKNLTESVFQAIQEVVGEHAGYSNDAIMLAVCSGTSPSTPISTDSRGLWEDKTMEHGFELIDFGNTGHNEYGEKQGIARVVEALTAYEWDMGAIASDEVANDDLFGLGDIDHGSESITLDESELGEDSNLKTALMSDQDTSAGGHEAIDHTEGDQVSVDDLGVMLGKLLAARDRVAGLPEEQRKKAAAAAVGQLMSNGF